MSPAPVPYRATPHAHPAPAVVEPVDTLTLRNAVAITADRAVPDATVVVRDGVVVEVDGPRRGPADAVDCRGAFVIPGIVDTHSDGLERELRPRPGVELDLDFALRSFEGRVRAAGVTTVFHGVGYSNEANYDRTVAQAVTVTAAVDALARSGDAIVDHHVLHRLDVRDADGLTALAERAETITATGGEPPLVSYEDHTPGRGQYRDRRWLERYVAGTRGLSEDASIEHVDRLAAERYAKDADLAEAMCWLGERQRRHPMRLMCHDPVDTGEIDDAADLGATIAEFPTSVVAAEHARRRGLRTVCGGPNALRGESHSGNVSARVLIALGLCDGLASDYLPSTLLGAAARLVELHLCEWPDAIRLITAGPAGTVGLGDRGSLEPGQRGDLVVFTLHDGVPCVRHVSVAPAVRRPDPLHRPRPT